MPQHPFLTQNRALHPRSAQREHRLDLLQLARRHFHQCTSVSTRLYCTTLSMATSVRYISDTSTALPSSCMRYLVTLQMRSALWFSGAVPIQEVRFIRTRPRHKTDFSRPRERCVYPSMLHGAHSVMATSLGARTHCADGPSMHAVSRRWLQPGRLRSERPGCHLWCVEGKGGGSLRTQGLQSRRVSTLILLREQH